MQGVTVLILIPFITVYRAATSKDDHDALRVLLDETPRDQPPVPEFYKLFAILTSQVYHRRLGHSVKRHIHQLLITWSPEIQKAVLGGLLGEDRSLIALGYVVDDMEMHKTLGLALGTDGEADFKKEVLAKYIRETILPKEVQSEWVLKQISEKLLVHVVSPEGFRSVLLPACQKAMLRSPETSIQVRDIPIFQLYFKTSLYRRMPLFDSVARSLCPTWSSDGLE